MKIPMPSALRQIIFIMLIAVSFTACKKNDTPRLSTPVAGIMAFNLASDQPAVGFSLRQQSK